MCIDTVGEKAVTVYVLYSSLMMQQLQDLKATAKFLQQNIIDHVTRCREKHYRSIYPRRQSPAQTNCTPMSDIKETLKHTRINNCMQIRLHI